MAKWPGLPNTPQKSKNKAKQNTLVCVYFILGGGKRGKKTSRGSDQRGICYISSHPRFGKNPLYNLVAGLVVDLWQSSFVGWVCIGVCVCVCVCVHVCVRPVGLHFFLPFFYSGGARNMRRLEPLVSSLQTDNLEDRAWDALRDRTVLDPCDPASL